MKLLSTLAITLFTLQASALETMLHFNKSDSGVTAASPSQQADGVNASVMAMTVGAARFLELQKNGSFDCPATASLQNGLWTVFGINVTDCTH